MCVCGVHAGGEGEGVSNLEDSTMKIVGKILHALVDMAFVIFMAILPAASYFYVNDFVIKDAELFIVLLIFGNVTGIAGIFIFEKISSVTAKAFHHLTYKG